MAAPLTTTIKTCTERRIPRPGGEIYVRDFPGRDPAFAVLHGFPDNGRIYEDLIPLLVAGGRRVVALDFLGFGKSDKPEGVAYSFAQQLGDLEAVVEALGLESITPVGHDAGGPASVNFALRHPQRTAAVVLINAFYDDSPGLRVPELIELFSNRRLAALHAHFLSSPQQFAWLLHFQRERLRSGLSDVQQRRLQDFLYPIIDENFGQAPSAAPAFMAMTHQLTDEIAANTARLSDVRRSDIPFHLIWGRFDPYLHVSVAEHLRSQFRDGRLHVLEAGHWPQIDCPEDVARILLGLG